MTDPTEPRSFDVFISYSHQDLEFTETLAGRLQAAGGQVFLDRWEIVPGDELAHRLDDGIRHSQAGILVFSPAATASSWVMKEYAALISSGRRFIPVLYRDTELPPFAASRVHVDFRDVTDSQFELKVTELVRALQNRPPADRPGRAATISFSDPAFWRLHPESIAEELAGLDPRTVAMTMSAVDPRAAAPVLAVLDEPDAIATVAHMRTESADSLVSAIGEGERTALLRDTITARDQVTELGRRHQGILGRPTSPFRRDEKGWAPAGFSRDFENGMVLWTARTGAYPVWHGVHNHFRRLGGATGRLGYPTSGEELIDGGPAVRQHFQNGIIFWSGSADTVTVDGPLAEHYQRYADALRMAVGEEHEAAGSPFGTDGVVQYFSGRWQYPDDRPFGAAIYLSWLGTYVVGAGIGIVHERAGGTGGWLGFPVADSTTAPGGSFQCFEGGVVFYSPTYDCVAVPNPPDRALPDPAQLIDRFGYPTADAPTVGDRVQFFERGLMSVQDGRTRFWTPADL